MAKVKYVAGGFDGPFYIQVELDDVVYLYDQDDHKVYLMGHIDSPIVDGKIIDAVKAIILEYENESSE